MIEPGIHAGSMGILPMHGGKTSWASIRPFATKPPSIRHRGAMGFHSFVENLFTVHGQDAHATGGSR
jgi:hypothetical protein